MQKYRKWVGIGLVALAVIARLIPGARTIDDSFITFRYARNILSGAGFIYNPGERVLGTTTPLYTFLMSGLGAVMGGPDANFANLALVVNAVADGLTCLLLWQLGKKLGSAWAGLAAGIAWAIAPFSVTFAIGGLETSMYVLLLTACVYFYLQRAGWACGLCAAGAFLTRIDALILLGPLALWWIVQALRKKERLPLSAVLAAGLPVAAWLIFSAVYFGSPIPQSVQAKLLAYRLEPTEALVRLLQHYVTPFMGNNLFGAVGIGVGLVLFPTLALIGARKAFGVEPRSLAWLAYPWLYFAVFAAANPLIFRWYLTPPTPVWMLLIFLGAAALLDSLRRRPKLQLGLRVALILIPVALLLSEWRWKPDHGPARPAPDMAYIQLELLYRQAADLLEPYLQAGDTLAAGDVGVLGFRTGARILDLVGLNSPQVSGYYPIDDSLYEINYAIAPDSIIDNQPDAVAILEVYGRKGLLIDPRFTERYRLLEKIPTDMYGSDGLLIYLRRP